MRSKALPGWAHTLCTAAAALVFLLAYELVVYRVPVPEIFLPVSSWSDEVIYSKQLAAAVQYRLYLYLFPDIEHTDSLGSVNLMPADRQQIYFHFLRLQ